MGLLCDVTDIRLHYAMSGTDTRMPYATCSADISAQISQELPRHPPLRQPGQLHLPSYAGAMRSPVLTCRVVRPKRALYEVWH
eukprot:228588-Rhodomonas_salina.1